MMTSLPYIPNQDSYQQNHQLKIDPYKMDNSFTAASSENITAGIMKSLFGRDASSWPYSEDAFMKALDLRICQENTKQEYYKVEKLNRVIELMKLATIAKVPGHLIPSLIEVQQSTQNMNSNSSINQSNNNSPYMNFTPPSSTSGSPSSNSPSPIGKPFNGHTRGKTISSVSELKDSTTYKNDYDYYSSQNSSMRQQLNVYMQMKNNNTNNNNDNVMKNFKFGSGSSSCSSSLNGIKKRRTSLPPKHQLSPSRIGAHAISSLNIHRRKKSIDASNFTHGARHNRTLSLPSSVTIPESKALNFHTHKIYSNVQKKSFDEIVIPDLSEMGSTIYNMGNPKTDHGAINNNNNNNNGNNNSNYIFNSDNKGAEADNENTDEDDVDKLINGPVKTQKQKTKKNLNGSPLKEMVNFEEISNDHLSINECSGAFLLQNESKRDSNAISIEPKTP